MNDKRKRFERVAGNRVQYIIDKIESLSKCSNRNNYEYTEKDIKKMFVSIKNKLKIAEQKYYDELRKKNKTIFKF
jgi:hypothetical protein